MKAHHSKNPLAVALIASIVVGFGSWNLAHAEAPPAACQAVELSIVESTHREPGKLYGRRDLLATTADLSKADVTVTEGQTVLDVKLSPQAAQRVRELTSRNVGGEIVFSVSGRSEQRLRIRDPITGDGIMISPIGRPEAERIALGINAGLPPCPAKPLRR